VTLVSRVPRGSSALGLALLFASLACENDVAVHLLPPAPVKSADPADPPDPPICVDGDPCSGHAWALSFKGAYDRVEVPSSTSLDLPRDFAVEAWVLVRNYSGGGHGVLNRWIAGVGDIQLTFGTPEPVSQLELPSLDVVPSHVLGSWAFVREGLWLTAVAPALPSADNWHHLAASYGGGAFRLYVDGTLASKMDSTEPIANPESTLYLGATARHERSFTAPEGTLYWPPIDGFIADVRLSSSNRYPADFVPEPHLVVDAQTIALWHLDEADGSVASDSGPSGLDGKITGATWALAPIRGSSSSL
jgi:Concanavalin A-like lectin/glucanases superfamily